MKAVNEYRPNYMTRVL